jgi:RimJ/RimL family protein N-acetyltransferase
MPVEHDPDGRRRLVDAGGETIGRFEEGVRDGTPMADLFERGPGVTVDAAAAAVLADLRGWRIAPDEALGRALVAAGGQARRHGHMYSRDLRRDPPPRSWDAPPGIRLVDIDRPVVDLIPARVAAYPPDHPDHGELPEDHAAELHDFIHGGQFGPLLAGSGLAIAADGSVVGAIILGTIPGDPPQNGPWIIDLFRAPGYGGVGRALVQRALALATVDTLGLIVTEGNDAARRLYEDLGFRLLSSALVVQL